MRDRLAAVPVPAWIGAALSALLTAVGLWRPGSGDLDPAPGPAPLRIGGEFEPQGALLLAAHDLLAQQPELLAEIVSAVHGRLPVWILVSHSNDVARAGRLFEARGVR